MKKAKIIFIVITGVLVISAIIAAFNVEWGEDNLPGPSDDAIEDNETQDSESVGKAILALSDGVKSEAYFNTPSGCCVKLSDGYVDVGTYSLCKHEAVSSPVYISVVGFYSDIYDRLTGSSNVTFEQGKTYYIWLESDDPRN